MINVNEEVQEIILNPQQEKEKIITANASNKNLARRKDVVGIFQMKTNCFLFCSKWREVVMILNERNLKIYSKKSFENCSSLITEKPLILIDFGNILRINKRHITKEDVNTFSIYYTEDLVSNKNKKEIFFLNSVMIKEIKLKCETRFELDYYLRLFNELKFKKIELKNKFPKKEKSLKNYFDDQIELNNFFPRPDLTYIRLSKFEFILRINFMNVFIKNLKTKTNYEEKIISKEIAQTEYELERMESYNYDPDSNDYLNEEDIVIFDTS